MSDENFDKELFSDENVPPSNFFKFETPGDRVSGEVVEMYDAPAKGNFPPQKVFCLKQKDGSIVNVGIAVHKTYLITRTKSVQMGDKLGFEFKKFVPSFTKGNADAKSIEVYIKHAEKKDDGFGGL